MVRGLRVWSRDTQILVSRAGRVGPSEYLDPSTSEVVTVDHFSRVSLCNPPSPGVLGWRRWELENPGCLKGREVHGTRRDSDYSAPLLHVLCPLFGFTSQIGNLISLTGGRCPLSPFPTPSLALNPLNPCSSASLLTNCRRIRRLPPSPGLR